VQQHRHLVGSVDDVETGTYELSSRRKLSRSTHTRCKLSATFDYWAELCLLGLLLSPAWLVVVACMLCEVTILKWS
jgi:hypothetical protein